jgi:hypothetical protein
VVCLGGTNVWESSKQPTAAASTMDAEYQVCGAATREALSLCKLLREFALLSRVLWPEKASVILCVIKAAVSLCSGRKEIKRAKHIDIVHHFAHDHVATGNVKLVYCKSEGNVSDCLTRALSRSWLESGLDGLGVTILTFQMRVCCNDLVVLEMSLLSTGECRNAR